MKDCFITKLLVVGLTLAAAADAWAIAVAPPEPIYGNSGNVVVGEREGKGGVEYWVDVLGSTELHALAISHGVASFGGDYEREWDRATLLPSQWNAPGINFSIGDNVRNTASYGSFESLFGDDPMVTIFYTGDLGALPITDADDQDQAGWLLTFPRFFVGGEFESELLALGGSGEVLDISIVPEPSSFALAAMSLAGLAAFRRKRKK